MRLRKKTQTRRSPKGGGAKSPPLTYYRSGESKSTSPFEKVERSPSSSRRGLVRFGGVIVATLLLAGFGYNMLIDPHAKVVLNSNVYRPDIQYQAVAEDRLGTFKNRNKFTIDEAEVEKALKEKFPEINAIFLHLPLIGGTPTINIALSPPILFLSTGGQTYLVNENGIVVAEAKEVPAVKNLPIVQDQSGFKVQKGQQILSGQAITLINLLLQQTKKSSLEIEALTLPPTTQELDLKLKGSSYFVKFLLTGEPLQQIGQFLAAKEQFEKSGEKPSEYLDVRVPGKVFYK